MQIRRIGIGVAVGVLLAGFLALAGYAVYKDRLTEQQLRELQQEAIQQRESVGASTFHVLADIGDTGETGAAGEPGDVETIVETEVAGEPVLTAEEFLEGYQTGSRGGTGAAITYRFPETLPETGVYRLQFRMRASDCAEQIYVDFGGTAACCLTTEWREYVYPCTGKALQSISWWTENAVQTLELSAVQVSAWGADTDPTTLGGGSRLVFGLQEAQLLEASKLGIGRTWDVLLDDHYLYSIGEGMLTITDLSVNTVLSRLSGLGNVRHICLRDGGLLAVSSRENGVWLINIEDKALPRIVGFYDALELANDICFAGQYMFVTNRYFGVEIVDISDPSAPVYVDRIANGKECYRCTVKGQHLFVSCRATQDVEVYDISVVTNARLVTRIQVDGKCGEVFIEDSLLYVVSGYSNTYEEDSPGKSGYGTGNGVAIYDITNIDSPVWCATIKTEGPLRGVGYDDWSVQVSGGYVCFTNCFGGAYLYDVSNPRAPAAVANLTARLPIGGAQHYRSPTGNVILPYNPSEYIVSPVMGVQIGSGRIYLACEYDDVYYWNFEGAVRVKSDPQTQAETLSAGEPERQAQRNLSYHAEELDLHALAAYKEGLYLAGSSEGLLLLDEGFAVVDQSPTERPVQDVRVTGEGYIVTAETDGMGTYAVEGRKLVRLGYLVSETRNRKVSGVAVTGDGKYAILQSSRDKYEAVDLHEIASPVFVETVVNENGETILFSELPSAGSMYYRNLITGDPPGDVGVSGGTNQIWFRSLGSALQVFRVFENNFPGEVNGGTLYGDTGKVLYTYDAGYVLYDPADTMEALPTYWMQDVQLRGKLSMGGSTLVAVSEPAGIISVINILEPTRPAIRSAFVVRESPGIALVEDERILVPLRHGGIAEITLEN